MVTEEPVRVITNGLVRVNHRKIAEYHQVGQNRVMFSSSTKALAAKLT